MSGFYFGNGNGYSYAIRFEDNSVMEFVSDEEAREYLEEETGYSEESVQV